MMGKLGLKSLMILGALLIAGAAPSRAEYAGDASAKRCWCQWGGGGGEMPSPFADTNRFVELADGEDYTLIGRIVFMGQVPYLQVSFDAHPWLASSKRKAYPFYRLNGPVKKFKEHEQKTVKVLVRAHVDVVNPKSMGTQPDSRIAITLTASDKVEITVIDGEAGVEWDR